ncbi:MAG: reverse transcriptase domain-containing protein [Nanoarchaeota archaeon]|jgi:RNA-directed DNA polymerase|nr:reverse transcriptase domain-containing protein [Nanoarchaeota archaeon]
MKSYKNLYEKIYAKKNLVLAWRKARKGKTKKNYVIGFEKDLPENIKILQEELRTQSYKPRVMETFVLKDPKTRKISKADFRDRIIHHAVCNIIEPIFDKIFIYDNSANRKWKGTLFAIKRFDYFVKKVSKNGKCNGWFDNNQIKGYCLKADIKHYFQEVNHKILLSIISKKIKCKKTMNLISIILYNFSYEKGIPLGNLTSQFFANIYLNELDYFAKHELKCKYYIRYVDDFILLCESKGKLEEWKREIGRFVQNKLNLELHPDKTKIINLSKGIDFVGFRNFYHNRLLRKRNIRKINQKIKYFNKGHISQENFIKSWQGWLAYSNWSNNHNLKINLSKKIRYDRCNKV